MTINNIDRFKSKIARGELCVGTSITFTDPAISELVGDAGYDFTWIDMEHCPIDIATALGHVMAVRGTNAAPFVRVPAGDPIIIKPILELHPAAIIAPQVQTVADVEQVVAACKSPPVGIRGFGPRRGRRFGGQPYPEYLVDADEQIMVIVQIEHIDAVDNLNGILAVEGLDGLCVGFNDLAGSMGLAGKVTDPKVIEVTEEVIRKTRQTDKTIGISMGYDPQAVSHWLGLGLQWISLGGDFNLLYAKIVDMLDDVRAI
ncbi:MAG: 4-hydroxy-3-methylbut-2-en-1-yl diphosphate synthase [Candidatus Latescibacteria bacterium]|nr:4-hydroxy-3-methylbut-2-en-1-yl diphosphate synthase [Candidatus Latescibacterota bacterium]